MQVLENWIHVSIFFSHFHASRFSILKAKAELLFQVRICTNHVKKNHVYQWFFVTYWDQLEAVISNFKRLQIPPKSYLIFAYKYTFVFSTLNGVFLPHCVFAKKIAFDILFRILPEIPISSLLESVIVRTQTLDQSISAHCPITGNTRPFLFLCFVSVIKCCVCFNKLMYREWFFSCNEVLKMSMCFVWDLYRAELILPWCFKRRT